MSSDNGEIVCWIAFVASVFAFVRLSHRTISINDLMQLDDGSFWYLGYLIFVMYLSYLGLVLHRFADHTTIALIIFVGTLTPTVVLIVSLRSIHERFLFLQNANIPAQNTVEDV